MTDLFNKTRDFIKKSYNNNKAQLLHFDRTVYWLKQLRPNIDEAFLIAAIGHDIERAFRKDKLDFYNNQRSFKDKDWLEYHSKKGAEILENFLKEQKVDEDLIQRVKHLVSKHELGGDDEQNLLKDADSLSFLENNAPIFLSRIDKLGYKRIKEKFDWMYKRITLKKAKKIAKPFYDKILIKLEKFNYEKIK